MNPREQGFLIPVILMAMLALTAMGTATLTLINSNFSIAQGEQYRIHAQFAADAGADAAIQQVNASSTWTGTSSEQTIMNQNGVRTTYTASVANDPTDTAKKTVSVTGRSYAPATSTKIRSERRYEVTLRGVGGGSYSVVTGVGGLTMSNSSKIVGGDVFVNGKITMSNSAQIGLTTNPVNVKAAHQSCPVSPNATYPRVCASGENAQPISLSNTARIYGEVRATNQTNGSGMLNPGLIANQTVEPLPLPTHDRNAQKAAVTTTISSSSANCSGGTRTWAANTKINGDVSISNGCKVTVQGNIWITGRLSMSNSSELIAAASVTQAPVIMIDSINGLELSTSSKLVSSSAPTPLGFRVVTYYSRASCSPDCTSVTGAELAATQGDTTIRISNGSSGPKSEFYSRWSAVELSNSGDVGAVVGQTVKLSNSAAIMFGVPVSSTGEPSAWVVSSYRRLY